MTEFLAPLDYRRAKDTLRAIDFYTACSAEGAAKVTALLRQRYPAVFARMEQKTFANGALLLVLPGANLGDPLVFVSHMDSLRCREPLRNTHAPFTAPLARAHVVALLEALDALLISGRRPWAARWRTAARPRGGNDPDQRPMTRGRSQGTCAKSRWNSSTPTV